MEFETISLAMSPRGIATVMLNRPERGNAHDQAMLAELSCVFTELAADHRVRIAVLRGSGKHFCAGADLADRTRAETGTPTGPTLFDVLEAIDRLPKPTIAAVHGGAIGGGAAIAACCDVVVATDAAFFSIPEVRVGMAPVRLAPIFIRAMGHRSFRRYGLALRARNARRGSSGDRRRAVAWCAGRNPRAQIGVRRARRPAMAGPVGNRAGETRIGADAGSRRGNCEFSRKTQTELVPGLETACCSATEGRG